MDRRQPILVQSSDGGTTPCHRAPDNLDLHPVPGNETDDVEDGDDKLTLGVAGGRYEGGSRRSSRSTRPRGACELRRRVFPNSFLHHVEDFDPSQHFARIPTAGGAASAAAALPRIVTAGEGGCGRSGFYGVNRGDTSTGTESPAYGLVLG